MGNCNLEIQVHNIFYKLGSDQIKTVQKMLIFVWFMNRKRQAKEKREGVCR